MCLIDVHKRTELLNYAPHHHNDALQPIEHGLNSVYYSFITTYVTKPSSLRSSLHNIHELIGQNKDSTTRRSSGVEWNLIYNSVLYFLERWTSQYIYSERPKLLVVDCDVTRGGNRIAAGEVKIGVHNLTGIRVWIPRDFSQLEKPDFKLNTKIRYCLMVVIFFICIYWNLN